MGRRFVIDGITTVNLIPNRSISKVTNVHSKHSKLVHWWVSVCKIGPALKQH